jgi:hypothetical protein
MSMLFVPRGTPYPMLRTPDTSHEPLFVVYYGTSISGHRSQNVNFFGNERERRALVARFQAFSLKVTCTAAQLEESA